MLLNGINHHEMDVLILKIVTIPSICWASLRPRSLSIGPIHLGLLQPIDLESTTPAY